MKKSLSFLIIGGDMRYIYLAQLLLDRGLQVSFFAPYVEIPQIPPIDQANLSDEIENANIIIAPIPYTKDGHSINCAKDIIIPINLLEAFLHSGQILLGGNLPASTLNNLQQKGVFCHDFLSVHEIARKNAIATAEAAIAMSILESPINLQDSSSIVLGYGQCGQPLVSRLLSLQSNVTISIRNTAQIEQLVNMGFHVKQISHIQEILPKADFIFNTIPAKILTRDYISLLHQDCTIIDIASAPGGTDFEVCKEFHIHALLCLGLPGRYSPKSSALILMEEINRIRKQHQNREAFI